MIAARKTIPLSGTCTARGELTLASRRIPCPFILRRIRATFAPGCQNLLALSIYASEDPTTPTSGAPTGVSVFQTLAPNDYLIGDGEALDLDHELPVLLAGTWLKVYAVNADYYDHAVSVQLTIDQIEEGA